MENYLEQLKKLVSAQFENAQSKEDIERCAVINDTISKVEQEQAELMQKNSDLLASYKDAIKHQSFNDPAKVPTDPVAPKARTFEEALKDFMSNNK